MVHRLSLRESRYKGSRPLAADRADCVETGRAASMLLLASICTGRGGQLGQIFGIRRVLLLGLCEHNCDHASMDMKR